MCYQFQSLTQSVANWEMYFDWGMTWLNLHFVKITPVAVRRKNWKTERENAGKPIGRLLEYPRQQIMMCQMRRQVVKLKRGDKIEEIVRRIECDGVNTVGKWEGLRMNPRVLAERSNWVMVLMTEMGNVGR